MTIPAEAIAAAARSMAEFNHLEWRDLADGYQATWLKRAEATLTAALPFIAAQDLRDAVSDFENNVGVGEFDEQNRRHGRPYTHSDEAWEHQGPYMGWLLNRADVIEGASQ